MNPLTFALVSLIRFYQATLSPDHGPLRIFFPQGACRYHPTCSDYARQALTTHGFIRGSLLGVKRLLRCHPWAEGGEDGVPPKK